MSRRVTIADVAVRAGVHKATVSRALNKMTEHQVNPATARRVRKAAEELGYVANAVARGLRTNSSMTVGVIIPDLTNPLFPPMVRGIEHYLAPHGYTALIANTDGDDDLERAAFDSLSGRRVDGFIIATGRMHHELIADAYHRGVHVVMLNRGSVDVPYPLVTGDDAAGVTAAVEHLVELGHRDLVHLAGPENFTTSAVRQDAFLAAVRRHADVAGRLVPAPALTIRAGLECMNDMLLHGDAPTAIVAGNDLLAVGILRSLRQHGLHCPDDVSVIGFNDMDSTEDLNPPLTTVRVPHFEMGTEAARLLIDDLAADRQRSVTVSLPASLVVRESTAAPRAGALASADTFQARIESGLSMRR
ncbi:MAG TPA: LacI family DNA-binding transcriptional regulator [Microbacteriaceae bacterium]|nr:LacI family DNA-binding transcriptional regulator [Microbacteriaceae bacterium]